MTEHYEFNIQIVVKLITLTGLNCYTNDEKVKANCPVQAVTFKVLSTNANLTKTINMFNTIHMNLNNI